MSYEGPERRASGLSDEDMEAIAEKAAARALQKVYAEVGKNVLQKILWFIGAATVAVMMWMGSKGLKL